MNFWDVVSKGVGNLADRLDAIADRHGDRYDTEFSVMDKEYCWEDLDYQGDYTLQRHVVTGTCRIIDQFHTVVDRGTQAEMEAAIRRRSSRPVLPSVSSIPLTQPVAARYGDIIGVVRKNGTYEHYGIYVSDTCVVHYAVPASNPLSPATVHCTSLRYFLRSDTEYFVLDFPKPGAPPVRVGHNPSAFTVDPDGSGNQDAAAHLADALQNSFGYHLYSPEQTVARARSRLGEAKYNMVTNNCEHFVIWCKTGVSESMQVNEMMRLLTNSANYRFRKPFRW